MPEPGESFTITEWDELVRRARRLIVPGERRILGIAGAPGSGKSTLGAALVAALAPRAVLVPMDGFHLASSELLRLGRRDRMGAPDTFDAAEYVALLSRLRVIDQDTVYAPRFDRSIEEPIAGAIPVTPDAALVVTEGNYLLLDDGPWKSIASLLDECWYVEMDDRLRLERLAARHAAFGKDPQAARDWAHGSDQRNTEIVAATRARADLVVRLEDPPA